MEARRLQMATGQVKEGQGLWLWLLIAASCKKYFDVTVIFASYKYVRGGGMFVNSYTFIFSSACQQQFLSFSRERARGSRGQQGAGNWTLINSIKQTGCACRTAKFELIRVRFSSVFFYFSASADDCYAVQAI